MAETEIQQKSFSVQVKNAGESLEAGVSAVIKWIKQQEQNRKDLQRETFHRCLIEALHYPEFFKKARWQ